MSSHDDRPREQDKLLKAMRLLNSDQPGEREAAAHAVHRVLQSGNVGIDDLVGTKPQEPSVQPAAAQPSSGIRNPFEGFDDYMEKKEPGYKARKAREHAEKTAAQAKYRRSVIAKYGSKKAAQAPDERERAIDAAAAPLARTVPEEVYHLDGTKGLFDQDTLDGWTGEPGSGDMPANVSSAVRNALPFPTTIAEAKAEYDYWEERYQEREATQDYTPDCGPLSLACQARHELVRSALRYELRARSIEEATLRCRMAVEDNWNDEKIVVAILADMEGLLALSKPTAKSAPATSGTAVRTHNGKGNGRQPPQPTQTDLFNMMEH